MKIYFEYQDIKYCRSFKKDIVVVTGLNEKILKKNIYLFNNK